MKIDWTKFFLAALAEAPRVIQTVEIIHPNKDSATKSDLAATALVSAAGVASDLDPNDTATIATAAQLSAGIIAAFNSPPPGAPAKPAS